LPHAECAVVLRPQILMRYFICA